MSYKNYLSTKHWHKKKKRIKDLRGNQCFICYSQKNIHIHHICYLTKNGSILGKEKDHQLIPLCASHHQRFHLMYGKLKVDLQFFKRAKKIFEYTSFFDDALRYAFNRDTYKIFFNKGLVGFSSTPPRP